MSLPSGTRFGPYEIVSAVGAGGMGEVYRARDTRLDRTVAIKVLPEHLSSDSELKQRMDREAKAISALQHANICTLYDIGSQAGINFLVMEYLEGETLAQRLAKGAVPLDQVLKIATEIAQALAKAHAHGIIHRDLKPANIMLTRAGAKLMDFGLAKPELSIASGSVGPLTPSTPTINVASLTAAVSPLTQKGSIVGTFQYMAPEILQGIEADSRSDIFSFGCVLYEMVTGRRAFDGKSQLSVFSAILEKDPDPITATQPLTPPMLDRVLRACLAKDPSDRFQSAHDLAMALTWISGVAPAETAKPAKIDRWWVTWTTALLLASIAFSAYAGFRWIKSQSAPEPPSLHAEIPPPDKYSLDTTGDNGGMPVLSPQGDKIAFVAHAGENKLLWVRSLGSNSAQALDGTSGASHPFWSPDGRSIGFFANGKLAKIAASGGPVAIVTDAPNSRGGSWGNGVIVFAPNFIGGLAKVSDQGGTAEPAASIDIGKHDTQRWPWFLPDGRHFIFLSTSHTSGDPRQNGIYFGSIDSPQTRLVVPSESAAQYASGYLLYRLNTSLVAQPFDPESGTLSGSPIPFLNNLRDDVGVWRSIFAVSQNGQLVYQAGNTEAARTRLVWYDRAGKVLGDYDPGERMSIDIRLSPDNRRAAFASDTGIWTVDLNRKTKTRVTFNQQVVQQPTWSPDGKTLMFLSLVTTGGGNVELRTKPSDGSGIENTLPIPPNNYHYPAWSPDGRYITYTWGDGEKDVSVWRVPASGEFKPVAIVKPPSPQFYITGYRVSPDSRWLAYVSDESGQQELYITSFPDGKGKWKVSSGGAAYPAWTANGKELLYISLTSDFFACSVNVKGDEIDVGTPERLFHSSTPGNGIPFDAAADGRRFLVNHTEDATQVPLQLVTNWPAELKK